MGKQTGCLLCGKSHHVRFCKLPGAALFRRTLKAVEGKKKVNKQSIKKPSRYASMHSRGIKIYTCAMRDAPSRIYNEEPPCLTSMSTDYTTLG